MSPTICLRLKRTYISLKPMITNRKTSEKRHNSIMYGIYSNFIQVIYSLDTNCEPHIMILAPVVIQIPCSQSPLWLKCLSLKRGIIQLTIHKILRKVNQVTWFMYPNSMHGIMNLAQAVLQIFCWQDYFTTQDAKVGKKVHNSIKYFIEICQTFIRSSTPWTQSVCQILWS